AVGGLPVSEKLLSIAERTKFSLHLLDEAVCHALMHLGFAPTLPGRFSAHRANQHEFDVELRSLSQIQVNHADTRALDSLPGISSQIAQNIVDDRVKNGPFRSVEELDRRVKGLGSSRLAAIENALDFSTRVHETLAANFEGNLLILMSQYMGTRLER